VQDLGDLELLVLRLPAMVGSPLSINALREDLQLSHKTVDKWVEILERLCPMFRLPPFGAPGIRAIKKAQKHYHFDWSLVPDPAARFENMVASHLLKWVHFRQHAEGLDLELRYFRDSDGREVDSLGQRIAARAAGVPAGNPSRFTAVWGLPGGLRVPGSPSGGS